jgi:hypothetical protein
MKTTAVAVAVPMVHSETLKSLLERPEPVDRDVQQREREAKAKRAEYALD